MITDLANLYFNVVSLLVFVSVLGVGVVIYLGNKNEIINKFWFYSCLCASSWSAFFFLVINAETQNASIFLRYFLDMFAILVTFFWFKFVIYFCGINSKRVNLYSNLLTIIILGLNFSPWFIKGMTPKYVFNYYVDAGPGYYLFLLYFLILSSYGTYRLFQYLKIVKGVRAIQTRNIILSSIVAFIGGGSVFLLSFNIPIPPYPFIFFAGLPLIIAYSVAKYHLFDVKVIATEIFAFGIFVFFLIKTILSNGLEDLVINGIFLAINILFGILLIRSVINEVEQRERIEKLAKELEEANVRQESLLHFIGHEIKGYFTKSHWALSSMVDGDYGEIAPDLKALTSQAIIDTKQGIDMVESILKAGNLKKGTVTYEMKPFDFKGEVKNVIEMLRPNIETKKLALQINIDENQDYTFNGDGEQISKHVLRNLIDNAIKYTPAGTITIGLSKKDGKILFSVKDSGVGITDEDKKRLFTEGGRGKNSVKVNVHSTGYGLFISKQIVDAHKGKIWADSAGPNQGSTFFVEI